MTQTLAEILAETTLAEKTHSLGLATKRANAESAEAAKNWKLVTDFFEAAKVELTSQIVEKLPTKKLGVLVGNTGNKRENDEVYDLFELYRNDLGFYSQKSKYFPLWKQFNDWSVAQGLQPVWEYQHDGVGMYSWYV